MATPTAEDDARDACIRARFAAQLGGRPDGPQRVVLTRDRETEHGGHTVLIGVVDDAAVTLDRPADDLLGTAPERLEDLGVDVVCGPDHIGAQDRDHPAPALRRGLGAARRGGWLVGKRVCRRGRSRFELVPRREWRRLIEDRLFQFLELRARVEAELVGQIPAGILVGLEGLGLAAVGIQRQHQQPPQPLPAGLVGHEATELGDGLAAGAYVDARLVQLLDGLQPELFEPISLASRKTLVGHVTQGGS